MKEVKVLPLQNPPEKEKNFGQHLKKNNPKRKVYDMFLCGKIITQIKILLQACTVFSTKYSQMNLVSKRLRNKNSLTGEC